MKYVRATSAIVAAGLLSAAARNPDPLRQAIAAPDRDPAQVSRDTVRHPYEELRFFGVEPTSSVVEIWPGTQPYWTPILARYLHDRGRYYLALGPEGGSRLEGFYVKPPAQVAADPAHRSAPYERITLTRYGASSPQPAPTGSVDFVLTFRNLHNWVNEGDAAAVLAGIHRALTPGGILGIEDHRARPDRPQDPKAEDGYLREDYTIALVERAGFRLVGKSELLANPRDTTHWPAGVWTLPPSLQLGDTDRAKYEAVGEADNYLLKFRKVG